MTQAPERIPEFDLADRMRKSLREVGIDVQEMAAYLGCSRSSVSGWINGRITPSLQTQRLWALRCGVPFEWLRNGAVQVAEPGPDGGATVAAEEKSRTSDQKVRGSSPFGRTSG